MSKEEEMIIVLLKEKEKLKEEICNLKDTIEKIDNQRAFYSIKNMDKKDRIDQAIEYIDNAPTLDYGTTKEFNIKEFPFVQHILEILKGGNDE